MPVLEPTAVSRPRPPDLVPGYRLEKPVGKGGMGEVWQAVQLSLGRPVAVKLLNAELAKDDSFVARFEKEGAALAALRHPNIVSIVDRGKTGDSTYYLVMEFIDGQSLREVMRSPLYTAGQALTTFAQVCRALDYAHNRGVIHRDLKPENILFDEQAGGVPKVTDYGLAGLDEKVHAQPQHLTQTHVAMGTASYMAPEQQVDARKADQRADIYSLGVVLYEMLTGDIPRGAFEPPSEKKPELDKRLDDIVAKCLKPEPADRYNTVAELLHALEPLVPMVSAIGTAKTTPGQRVVKKVKDAARRALRIGEAIVMLAALSVVAAAFLKSGARAARLPAGQELSADVGSKVPLTSVGRIDKTSKTVTLGDGPDTVPMTSVGRVATLQRGTIVFPPPEDATVGRLLLDVEPHGDGLTVSADVLTEARPKHALEPLRELFLGQRPEPRSALVLMGEPGRYVALVVSGAGAEPRLEWALGQQRGTMSAPLPSAAGATHLEMKIDPATGELTALVGSGRDARVLGDPLSLGPKWKQAFGEPPRLAVGCLEGSCTFSQVLVKGSALAPPPAPLVVNPPMPEDKPTPPPVPPPHPPVVKKPVEKKPMPVAKKPVAKKR